MTRSLNARLEGTTSADCIISFEATDAGTGEAIDLTDVAITFTVRDAKRCLIWQGTVDDGITVEEPDTGEFTVWIPEATMDDVCPGEYAVGCVLDDDIVKVQFLIGTLTVRDGVV